MASLKSQLSQIGSYLSDIRGHRSKISERRKEFREEEGKAKPFTRQKLPIRRFGFSVPRVKEAQKQTLGVRKGAREFIAESTAQREELRKEDVKLAGEESKLVGVRKKIQKAIRKEKRMRDFARRQASRRDYQGYQGYKRVRVYAGQTRWTTYKGEQYGMTTGIPTNTFEYIPTYSKIKYETPQYYTPSGEPLGGMSTESGVKWVTPTGKEYEPTGTSTKGDVMFSESQLMSFASPPDLSKYDGDSKYVMSRYVIGKDIKDPTMSREPTFAETTFKTFQNIESGGKSFARGYFLTPPEEFVKGGYEGIKEEPLKAIGVGASFFGGGVFFKTIGKKLIPKLVLKYPKISKTTKWGLKGTGVVYGADVGYRTATSERPFYTLGRISTTEILPGYYGLKRGGKFGTKIRTKYDVTREVTGTRGKEYLLADRLSATELAEFKSALKESKKYYWRRPKVDDIDLSRLKQLEKRYSVVTLKHQIGGKELPKDVFYHAMPEKYLKGALKKGIVPRREYAGIYSDSKAKGYTFLTKDPDMAEFYAGPGWQGKFSRRGGTITKVKLTKTQMKKIRDEEITPDLMGTDYTLSAKIQPHQITIPSQTRKSRLSGNVEAQWKIEEFLAKVKDVIVGGTIAQHTQMRGIKTARPGDIDLYVWRRTLKSEKAGGLDYARELTKILRKDAGVSGIRRKGATIYKDKEKLIEFHPSKTFLEPNIEAVIPWYAPKRTAITKTPEGIKVLRLPVQLQRKIIGGYTEGVTGIKPGRMKDIPAYKTIRESLRGEDSVKVAPETYAKALVKKFVEVPKTKSFKKDNELIKLNFGSGGRGLKGTKTPPKTSKISETYTGYKPVKTPKYAPYKPTKITPPKWPGYPGYTPKKPPKKTPPPGTPPPGTPPPYTGGTPPPPYTPKDPPAPPIFPGIPKLTYLPPKPPRKRKVGTPLIILPKLKGKRTTKKSKKKLTEGLFITPSFTARVIGAKVKIPKTQLLSTAQKRKTGLELRRTPIVTI